MELLGLAMWQVLLLILAIAAVASFGITHVLRMLLVAYIGSTPENDKEPWWWNTLLRGLAIILGATVGALFSYAGVNVIVAAGVGLVGGVLNTMIVKIVKDRLRGLKVGPDKTDEE